MADSYQRDSSKHLVTGDMTKCNENGVVAVESKFGWLLSGAVPSQDNLERAITCNTVDTQHDYGEGLDTLLQKFWELDV